MASQGGDPSSPWIWSEQYQNYYRQVGTDAHGNPICVWNTPQPQAGPSELAPDSVQRPRTDSIHPEPHPAVPQDVRANLSEFIPGTPDSGWYEKLDVSYRMRTGGEAYHFFTLGKVFSMLHIQATSREMVPNYDSITVVKYGEKAFSQIRRFVIVDVRRGFVYACPITTYGGRATLKPGCVPSEHSVVYLQGNQPITLPGEGPLPKRPICIVPADAGITIQAASRIHYSKPYPIEMNVKVKDIGYIHPPDLSDVIRYFKEENHY